jgi:hypothetical protein
LASFVFFEEEEEEVLSVLEGLLFLRVSKEHSVGAALLTWKRIPRFAVKTVSNHLLFSEDMF